MIATLNNCQCGINNQKMEKSHIFAMIFCDVVQLRNPTCDQLTNYESRNLSPRKD